VPDGGFALSLPIDQFELAINKIQILGEAAKRIKRVLEEGEVEIMPGVRMTISPAIRTLLETRLANFLSQIDTERAKL